MPVKQKRKVKQSEWLKVMSEGQLTRDWSLKTKSEIAQDVQRARALAQKRTG